jgi:hypothetical protein
MLSSWISIVVQFALQASDPSWSCALTHRDPGVLGTYYLYCTQLEQDGVEFSTVGAFVPDAER